MFRYEEWVTPNWVVVKIGLIDNLPPETRTTQAVSKRNMYVSLHKWRGAKPNCMKIIHTQFIDYGEVSWCLSSIYCYGLVTLVLRSTLQTTKQEMWTPTQLLTPWQCYGALKFVGVTNQCLGWFKANSRIQNPQPTLWGWPRTWDKLAQRCTIKPNTTDLLKPT